MQVTGTTLREAQKMVDNVNKQLSKKAPPTKKFAMPEAVTEGQNPDSIKKYDLLREK